MRTTPVVYTNLPEFQDYLRRYSLESISTQYPHSIPFGHLQMLIYCIMLKSTFFLSTSIWHLSKMLEKKNYTTGPQTGQFS